jgi:hypothetical protein
VITRRATKEEREKKKGHESGTGLDHNQPSIPANDALWQAGIADQATRGWPSTVYSGATELKGE